MSLRLRLLPLNDGDGGGFDGLGEGRQKRAHFAGTKNRAHFAATTNRAHFAETYCIFVNTRGWRNPLLLEQLRLLLFLSEILMTLLWKYRYWSRHTNTGVERRMDKQGRYFN